MKLKKKIAIIFSLAFLLCLPASVLAKDYHYSDGFISIDMGDTNYSSGRSTYYTAYACKSRMSHSKITTKRHSLTRSGYQNSYAKLEEVERDDKHQHTYWNDN